MVTRFLTVSEVAAILNISKAFVYKQIRSGELPSMHLGSAVRVCETELKGYIEECRLMSPVTKMLPGKRKKAR